MKYPHLFWIQFCWTKHCNILFVLLMLILRLEVLFEKFQFLPPSVVYKLDSKWNNWLVSWHEENRGYSYTHQTQLWNLSTTWHNLNNLFVSFQNLNACSKYFPRFFETRLYLACLTSENGFGRLISKKIASIKLRFENPQLKQFYCNCFYNQSLKNVKAPRHSSAKSQLIYAF